MTFSAVPSATLCYLYIAIVFYTATPVVPGKPKVFLMRPASMSDPWSLRCALPSVPEGVSISYHIDWLIDDNKVGMTTVETIDNATTIDVQNDILADVINAKNSINKVLLYTLNLC